MYKKAGVYSVLKRIEVWQARTGKRLSESFRGSTGEWHVVVVQLPYPWVLWSPLGFWFPFRTSKISRAGPSNMQRTSCVMLRPKRASKYGRWVICRPSLLVIDQVIFLNPAPANIVP